MNDMNLPKRGIYRHFKGGRYELIDFAKHSETLETMVVYRALYGEGGLWVRPLSMWSETVERDGQTYTRFLPEEEYLRLQEAREREAAFEDAPPPEDAPPENVDSAAPPEDGLVESGAAAEAPSAPEFSDKLDVLKRVYGYDSFREGQAEVIDAILEGRDALAVLPTGAGKSVCYQIPAQLLPGVALVISPLISLMKDQVEALAQSGVPAAYLNSSLTERQFDAALRRLRAGRYRIVYVAPERLQTPRFLSALASVPWWPWTRRTASPNGGRTSAPVTWRSRISSPVCRFARASAPSRPPPPSAYAGTWRGCSGCATLSCA